MDSLTPYLGNPRKRKGNKISEPSSVSQGSCKKRQKGGHELKVGHGEEEEKLWKCKTGAATTAPGSEILSCTKVISSLQVCAADLILDSSDSATNVSLSCLCGYFSYSLGDVTQLLAKH